MVCDIVIAWLPLAAPRLFAIAVTRSSASRPAIGTRIRGSQVRILSGVPLNLAGSAIGSTGAGANIGANLAVRYLRAVASRSRLADRYAVELAEAVLELPLFRLALDVIDCEKHTYSRATELATAVLEAYGEGAQPAAANGDSGNGSTGTDPERQP